MGIVGIKNKRWVSFVDIDWLDGSSTEGFVKKNRSYSKISIYKITV